MVTPQNATAAPRRSGYQPAVGPRLRKLLSVVLALFALMSVNSVYLLSITVAGARYQNWFYLLMFCGHLALGLLLVLPVIFFGILHMRAARHRPNRRAVRAGYALFAAALFVFVSGIVLLRVDLWGVRLEVNQPVARSVAYWAHIVLPLAVMWLFVLHRLAGPRIHWKRGATWAAVAGVVAVACVALHQQDPRSWNVAGPASGERYFFPSLARTSTGNFIAAQILDNNRYCLQCHADVHDRWSHSAHRFSSFNNPPYAFSVRETRQAMMSRDGNTQGSRFCAGCHDPVPFFSGAFDDPKFDDPSYDLTADPLAQAGITCTTCHAISHINSPRGNADYTITEPIHYPFALSENAALAWVGRQLVKAKPAFHKATFLKPLHRTPEFCGTCHKVHLPPELNDYKWLRGQNHYDSFLLSGVSGHGVASFYYPPVAEQNCNRCHMPLRAVSAGANFAARVRDDSGQLKTFDHLFLGANTALPHLFKDELRDADGAIDDQRAFLEGAVRVDLFGLRKGGTIEGELVAPLRPRIPPLRPGETYLLETVVRTVRLGHVFTQGTADSNEVWLEVKVSQDGRLLGHSGGLDRQTRAVDPWAHRINAFVLDRDGNRIDRRNAQDIFVPLYDHQIPPGAADVVHYRLKVPAGARGPVRVEVQLHYRKFDTQYMRLVTGDAQYINDLPIVTLARDVVSFPLGADSAAGEAAPPDIPLWQRWNDYGIGLYRKGALGELRQAREAFAQVQSLGRPEGPLHLARVYLKEGLVQTHAPQALARAAQNDPPARPWSLLWFGAQIARANGDLDQAIENLTTLLEANLPGAAACEFDFTKDYRVWVELGSVLYLRALQLQEDDRRSMMAQAQQRFERALQLDPENLAAHWGLKQVFRELGRADREAYHAAEHARYKPDDNARERAVRMARRKYPAANEAAEAVVIYDLERRDAADAEAEAAGG